MELESSCKSPPPPPPPRPPPPPPPFEVHEDAATPAASPPPDTLLLASPSTDQSQPAKLHSHDLRDKIIRQVEYYFSDENLPTDKFLFQQMKRDKEGYVPISLIASFRKMKKLVQDLPLVEAALRMSFQLVVSSDGKRVKRLVPFKKTEISDPKSRTVIVENLPEDCSTENIEKIFGKIGKINNVTICDPHQVEESASNRRTEIAISSKLHALIDYETVEAAESAVTTLNDEKNWRTGMRVELLLKRMGKYGFTQRGHKQTFAEKKNNGQESDIATDGKKSKVVCDKVERVEKEEEELVPEKDGRKGRYKNRGRGQPQQNIIGHGHGHTPSSTIAEATSKPARGPRMPDGTRGFTMGRGKKPSV